MQADTNTNNAGGSMGSGGSSGSGGGGSSGGSYRPSNAIDAAARAAHGAVDQAVAATTPAARWLEEKEAYINDQLKGTCEYVSAHPIKSLAIAFLAGYLFGKVM